MSVNYCWPACKVLCIYSFIYLFVYLLICSIIYLFKAEGHYLLVSLMCQLEHNPVFQSSEETWKQRSKLSPDYDSMHAVQQPNSRGTEAATVKNRAHHTAKSVRRHRGFIYLCIYLFLTSTVTKFRKAASCRWRSAKKESDLRIFHVADFCRHCCLDATMTS